MEKKKSEVPRIIYSCYTQITREGENYISDHVLSYLIEGSQEIIVNDKKHTHKAGDFRYFSRDQLAKFVKIPSADGKFSNITIRLDRNTLANLSVEQNIRAEAAYTGDGIIVLPPDILLKNYFKSLEPYYDRHGNASETLINIKLKEAVMILLETEPTLKNTLFDFRAPGKIDLEGYMLKHYRFNVPIERFAYLTGRSLATFKRDFQKIFHIPPHAWLMQKRIADARELLILNKLSVADVFQEVGFKDFSHFSYAFKKQFGYTPSSLKNSSSKSNDKLNADDI